MSAARSAATEKIRQVGSGRRRDRADPGKSKLPSHLHVDNSRDLGDVFQATPKRVKEALARHPRLAGKVRVTIGHDGDVYARAMRTAHVLFGWRFDRAGLAEQAPNLRGVHAHGAGINHLMPLD